MTDIPKTLADCQAFKQPSTLFEVEFANFGDGYDRMDTARHFGWRAVSSWGRDGWDLLDWPYYVLYVRNVLVSRGPADGVKVYDMSTNCESTVEVWRFPTLEAREAAIDLFAFWHWKTKDRSWVADLAADTPVDQIPARLRGPFSWARLDKEAQPS